SEFLSHAALFLVTRMWLVQQSLSCRPPLHRADLRPCAGDRGQIGAWALHRRNQRSEPTWSSNPRDPYRQSAPFADVLKTTLQQKLFGFQPGRLSVQFETAGGTKYARAAALVR